MSALDADVDLIDLGDPVPLDVLSNPATLTMDVNGVDTPASTATTEVLASGGVVFGTAAGSDHDWYRVNLVAGTHYAFATETADGTNPDPNLTLRDASGAQIVFDDNSGPGLDALLTYTPTASGVYYIDVGQSQSTGSVDYALGMAQDLTQVDTVPGNASTTATLAVGGSVDGVIETFGDTDWYAVSLTAGQNYLFTLNASGSPSLGDPYLNLYGSNGQTLLAFDDDDGGGTNSALRYTAPTSGTYYISAEAYSIETGDYHLALAAIPPQNPLNTIDWGTKVANPNNITIYFAQMGETYGGNLDTQSWNSAQIAAALAAVADYSAVANLTFTQTSSAAGATMILVLDANLGSGVLGEMNTPPTLPTVGTFNPNYMTSAEVLPGGIGFDTLLHEFGHGLGMAHPHDNGGTSEVMEGVTGPFGSYGDAGLNQGVFTVMSYNDGYPSVSGGDPGSNLVAGYEATPMALDVALMQQKYGATTLNPGDNVYTLESVAGRYVDIWDTGGNDTISYSGSADATIDLRPATLLNLPGGGGYVSSLTNLNQAGGHGGYTIAAGVVIENAIGGSGNDTLTGNDADNLLMGGPGDDTLNGGAGSDTASYSTAPSGVTVSLAISGAQDTIGAGHDTLINIEDLTGSAFNDTLAGDANVNTLIGGAGNDTLSGGDGGDILIGGAGNDTLDGGTNVDTAIFSGNLSAYTITHVGDVFTVTGPDGTDTLTNVESAQFNDQTIHLFPGVGTAVNFNSDPSTFMGAIRDFDGNNLGDASGWQSLGTVDVQGDGTLEHIYVNAQNGRWAEVGTAPDGDVYFDDHGWGGDTRVVGIYVDPLVQNGTVQAGSDFDSQRRFQNDLNIGNVHAILGAGDYNHDGLQEVYFSLTDGTAYLHAYMHADGNIEYANYQSEAQVISYLTSEGYGSSTWSSWFPDGGAQHDLLPPTTDHSTDNIVSL